MGVRSAAPPRGALTRDPGGDLCAALETHLRQQGGDVVLHGFLGDAEALPDLAVRQAVADEVENLALGVGQVRRRIVMIGPATRDRALVEQNTPRRNSAHNVAGRS